jgi:hypothetical protein
MINKHDYPVLSLLPTTLDWTTPSMFSHFTKSDLLHNPPAGLVCWPYHSVEVDCLIWKPISGSLFKHTQHGRHCFWGITPSPNLLDKHIAEFHFKDSSLRGGGI